MALRKLVLLALLVLIPCASALAQDDDSEEGVSEENSSDVSYPSFGFWNGYFEQLNILECLNQAAVEIDIEVTLFASDGTTLASQDVSIPSKGARHVVLNTLATLTDRYGSHRVSIGDDSGGLEGSLRCHTSVYRQASDDSLIYAYAFALRDPGEEKTRGIFNSFNPEQGSEATQNWLTILSLEAESFSATVTIYNLDGSERRQVRVDNLSRRGRIDIPLGHDETENGGQLAGMYQIDTEQTDDDYIALLTRYVFRDGSPVFAMPVRGVQGNCLGIPVLASTYFSATNWLEVANARSEAVDVVAQYIGADGQQISSEAFRLAAKAQRHIYLNSPFGEDNKGYVRFSCSGGDEQRIIVQNLLYGFENGAKRELQWAYLRHGVGPVVQGSEIAVAPVNTFLGAANWLQSLELLQGTATFDYTIYDPEGTSTQTGQVNLSAGGRAELGIHELVNDDVIGTASLDPQESSVRALGELLRVYPPSSVSSSSSTFGAIMQVPLAVMSTPLEPGNIPTSSFADQFLMTFHACDTSVNDCTAGPDANRLYLAQSDDGLTWRDIEGFEDYDGDVPDLIRRGNTLYIFTPSGMRRYRFDTGVLEISRRVTIANGDDEQDAYVDPGMFLDDQQRLVLFYLLADVNGDPAKCESGATSCTKTFRSATEVAGSDGLRFVVDPGDRAQVTISDTEFASDPDVIQGPDNFIMYVFRGPDGTQIFTSNDLRGTYTAVNTLPDATLTTKSGIPAGYYDADNDQFWIYVHTDFPTNGIERAVHNDFNTQLTDADFTTVINPSTFPGLGANFRVASPGITENAE